MIVRVLVIGWWEMQKLGIAWMSDATITDYESSLYRFRTRRKQRGRHDTTQTKMGRKRADIIGVAIYVRGRV